MFKKMLLFFFISSSLLFYGLIGFYILPPLIKKELIQAIEKVLRQKASIDSVSFNPFTFKIGMHQLLLSAEKDGEILGGIEEFEADIDPSYLLLKEIRIRSVLITNPSLHIRKNKAGEVNLFDLLRRNEQESEPDKPKTELANIVMDALVISGGKITLTDDSGSKRVVQSLTPITLKAYDLSTRKKSKNELTLYAASDDGGHLEYKAKIDSLAPLHLEGKMELRALRLQTYWRYFQDSLGFSVAEGAIDASVSHTLSFSDAQTQLDINKYKINLHTLLLQEKQTKEELLRLGHLRLEGSADLTKKQIDVAAAEAKGLFLKVKQNSEGEINWLSYFPMQEAEQKSTIAGEPSAAWSVKSLKVTDARVEFEDNFNADKARIELDDLTLHVENLSSKEQRYAKSSLAFLLNKTGTVALNGEFSHTPLRATAALEVKGLELASLQAYLDRHADIEINSGMLDLNLNTQTADQNTTFVADLQIDAFKVSRPGKKPFAAFKRLSAKVIDIALNPHQVKISNVNLAAPYLRVDIDADKTSNFSGIMRSSKKRSEEADQVQQPFEFYIGKITLNEGEIAFADRSLEIPFKADIHSLKGSIIAAGSLADVKSVVDLDGVVDKYALAKIAGSLLLADPKEFTEMGLQLKNIQMHTLSSYLSKFIGYRLKEGKLDADLRYTVTKSQMKGSNKIVLTHLELGEKLESSTAVPPSIALAIALLKDSRGIIDLDIPISGNLDAPGFAIAPLVWKAFENLTVGIATAPFRFIAKIVGIDADKLENIYFEAGKSALLPPQKEVLDKLSEIMVSKKSLLLKISGSYDDALDTREMKRDKVYQEALKKLEDASMEEISQIDKEDLENPLKELYVEYFGKASLDRVEKSIAAEAFDAQTKKEMLRTEITEALLKEQALEEAELEKLAQERGQSILDHLHSKGVQKERLELLPGSKAKTAQSGYVPSRLSLDAKR